ncbi:hypothetical protein LCGC14_0945580 [marine sediment metagenome]|uniref:Uncharacterized protein n=1 Tax=marine sediment metagenome TaxID=412755 RepID=A0A0F9RQ73_9ZZZZ
MSEEKDFEKKLKEKFGDVLIISQKKAIDPETFKAIQEFQYGETREISDKGFDKIKNNREEL